MNRFSFCVVAMLVLGAVSLSVGCGDDSGGGTGGSAGGGGGPTTVECICSDEFGDAFSYPFCVAPGVSQSDWPNAAANACDADTSVDVHQCTCKQCVLAPQNTECL